MNIFYTDADPAVAAVNMVDRHVVKMILESAQLLSTAHRIIDGTEYVGQSRSGRKAKRWRLPADVDDIMYSATHINHPSAVWVRRSSANYDWLYSHLMALGDEYTFRYGRVHATISKLEDILKDHPKNIEKTGLTEMPSCMADEYKVGNDPIENYRNYYAAGKSDLHRWTKRLPPQWLQGNVVLIDEVKMIHTVWR